MKEKYYIHEKTHLATEQKFVLYHSLKINKQGWEVGVLISSKGVTKNRKINKLPPSVYKAPKSSHKKRKDSLEVSLDRVLFAAELEFPKILVRRLPLHTSNVNIECAEKSEWSKQLYSLYVTSFLEHWYNLILLFWY